MSHLKHHARASSRHRPVIGLVAAAPTPPSTPYPAPDPALPEHRPRRLLSDLSSDERKQYPVVTGFIDYFPDAVAAVAHVSFLGNEKHNPGQALHWSRGKSSDHDDCQGRHLIERDAVDPAGVLHMAQKAWRAMAELQEFLEKRHDLDLPRGATKPGVELPRR